MVCDGTLAKIFGGSPDACRQVSTYTEMPVTSLNSHRKRTRWVKCPSFHVASRSDLSSQSDLASDRSSDANDDQDQAGPKYVSIYTTIRLPIFIASSLDAAVDVPGSDVLFDFLGRIQPGQR